MALILGWLLLGTPLFSDCYTSIEGSLLLFKISQDVTLGHSLDFGAPPNQGAGTLPGTEGVTQALNEIKQQDLKIKPTARVGYRINASLLEESGNLFTTLYYANYQFQKSQRWDGIATPNPFAPDFDIGNVVSNSLLHKEIPLDIPSTMISKVIGFWAAQIQDYGVKFGYPFNEANGFIFKPIIGLKGVLIRQSLHFERSLIRINTLNFSNLYEAIHQVIQYNGMGIEGGLMAEYAIGGGFSGFGALYLALLYGDKIVKGNPYSHFIEEITQHTTSLTFQKLGKSLSPCFDSSFGLSYHTPKFFHILKARFKLAFENHLYFKQNFFRKRFKPTEGVVSHTPSGNLATYGIVFSGAVEF